MNEYGTPEKREGDVQYYPHWDQTTARFGILYYCTDGEVQATVEISEEMLHDELFVQRMDAYIREEITNGRELLGFPRERAYKPGATALRGWGHYGT